MYYMHRIFSAVFPAPPFERFSRNETVFTTTRMLVSFFYYFMAYWAFHAVTVVNNVLDRGNFEPLWPIPWAHAMPVENVIHITLAIFVATTVLGVLAHHHRNVRILVFLGTVQYHAVISSFGGNIAHNWYPLLYVAFFFIFVPNVWKHVPAAVPYKTREQFLRVFWGAQALILLTYTMAGLHKLWGAFRWIQADRITIFSPDSAALYVSDWLLLADRTSVLGPFVVAHPTLSWLALMVILYLQVFAVFVAFRPSLHQIWGIGLFLFHIANVATMDIIFRPHAFIVLLLFAASPFAASYRWHDTFRDFPVIGFISCQILKGLKNARKYVYAIRTHV